MENIIVEQIEDFGLSKKQQQRTLFSKIGIIGCGKDGQNIARIASAYGIEVIFIELTQDRIENAYDQLGKVLDRRIENWGMTHGEKKLILSRIKGSMDYTDLKECDFVIEAIRAESSARKITERKEVFRKVEKVVSPDCIIATNSTTIIITELASELEHRERCVSLHFFVQSPEAKICEVVKGLYTSDEVYARVLTFVKMVNRQAIPVEESAGLISIRLYTALLNEACEVLMEGVGSLADIDTVWKIGFGMRFGPFELADVLGIDKINRWMENLYSEFGDPMYMPSPVVKKLNRAKRYGKHVCWGFYKYDENGKIIGSSPLTSERI
ncbi:MAG TPA: 3-hydroxyacyl-CoA dehydrogenase family protein [Prolixibacteraceae bacterium]|nr:3-hydroxyacyl-CoA dehydrogenase family protein [Prolixibacteraceae bacterium]